MKTEEELKKKYTELVEKFNKQASFLDKNRNRTDEERNVGIFLNTSYEITVITKRILNELNIKISPEETLLGFEEYRNVK